MGDLVRSGYSNLHNMGGDLDRMLMVLEGYGEPTLYRNNSGWTAWLEMRTSAAGSEFKVKSEYGHKTPRAAVAELAERVCEALKNIGVAP